MTNDVHYTSKPGPVLDAVARGKPVKPRPLSPVLPSKAKPKLDIKAERKFLQVDGATRWLKRSNDTPMIGQRT